MSAQFIFTMHKVSRFYPPDREVLKDISLSFYPGAKIGVLGANGSGKSSLLQIMAGLDDDFTGEARLTPGFTRRPARAGAAPRPDQGRHRQRDGRRRRDGDAARALRRGAGQVGRPRRRLREARRRAGRARAQDRGRRRLGPQAHHRDRHGRAAHPGRRRRRHDAVGRRAAPRGAVPAAAERARPAAARRAHQPPRRRVGRVARALPAGLPRHRRGHHPRSLLPRQRGPVDPRARPRPRHPLRGQLQLVARAEAGAARAGGQGRLDAPAHPRARARVGAHGAQGAPGQGQGPPRRLREAAGRVEGGRRPGRQARDRHPARASASATSSSRPSTWPRASAIACSSTTSASRSLAPASSA